MLAHFRLGELAVVHLQLPAQRLSHFPQRPFLNQINQSVRATNALGDPARAEPLARPHQRMQHADVRVEPFIILSRRISF